MLRQKVCRRSIFGIRRSAAISTCGSRHDGTWYYLGTPIGRPALVKLFSTILKREDGKYFLVTPVEKVGIRVDDAPFLAVEMEKNGEGGTRKLNFRTNVDDWVPCDGDHRLRFEAAADGGLTPYLHVRADLWAKVTRALYYDLVEMGKIAPSMAARCSGSCPAASSFRWRTRHRRESLFDERGFGLTKSVLKDAASANVAAPVDMSSGEFFRRARERLNFDVPPGLTDADVLAPTGDFGTDAMLQIIAKERPVRPAAVLVPIVEHEMPTVLLTKRAEHLNEHAGQISFPGGKIDSD